MINDADDISQKPDDALVKRRVLSYWAVGAGLAVGTATMRGSDWQGSAQLHTLMEGVATVLALMVGVMALVRYTSRKSNTFLFIGTGFLGTALLDGYHAVVTSAFFAPYLPSDLPSLIPWSWIASRLFLSAMLCLSWLAWLRSQRLGEAGRISERTVYLFGGALTLASFLFFAFVPLPRAYYPEFVFHRPEEFAPALLFLVALAGYLRKGKWRRDQFEHWLVLALIVGVASQAMFMSFSGRLFDFEFDAAHLLKKASYVCVLAGLLFSMFSIFRQAEQRAARLRETGRVLTATIENFPGGISVMDANLRLVAFNRAFGEVLEFPPHLVRLGAAYEDFIRFNAERGEYGDGDTGQLVQARVELARRFEPHCLERTRPTGEVIEIRGAPMPEGGFITTYIDITESKRAGEALRASEQRYRELFDESPAAIWTEDWSSIKRMLDELARSGIKDWREYFNSHRDQLKTVYDLAKVTEITRAAIDLYRAESREELLRTSTAEVVIDEELDAFLAIVLAFQAGRTTVDIEAKDRAGDGSEIIVRRQAVMPARYRDDWSQVMYASEDVTELRQREEALRSKTAKLALMEAVASSANEIIDTGAFIQSCVDDICRYSGWPVGHAYRTAGDGGGVLHSTKIWHLADPARFEAFRQLTERTSFEPGNGVPGRVMASGRPVWVADLSQDSTCLRVTSGVETGVKGVFAVPVKLRNRCIMVLEFYSSDAKQPDQELLGVIANVAEQIGRRMEREQADQALRTAKAQAEKARRHAQSAAEEAKAASLAKSDFLANMSHELRTPLNGILGLAALIEQETLGPLGHEQYAHYIKIIGSSGRHLVTVINDVLDYSKIEAGMLELDPVAFELSQVTDITVELLASTAQEKAIGLTCNVAPEVPPNLIGDPVRLRQILLNLAGNAIKFTEQGGVRVEVSREAVSGDEISLRFDISDTGIGIAKQAQETLFDKFTQADASTTRKHGGTGLGLAISKQLVKLMDGEIGVDSEPGQGSTFWFTAKLARQADEANCERGISGAVATASGP